MPDTLRLRVGLSQDQLVLIANTALKDRYPKMNLDTIDYVDGKVEILLRPSPGGRLWGKYAQDGREHRITFMAKTLRGVGKTFPRFALEECESLIEDELGVRAVFSRMRRPKSYNRGPKRDKVSSPVAPSPPENLTIHSAITYLNSRKAELGDGLEFSVDNGEIVAMAIYR